MYDRNVEVSLKHMLGNHFEKQTLDFWLFNHSDLHLYHTC
jgi:hypothetical protein